MPNRQESIDIINNALQSDNKKVIVLKGNWGIGKTYLWKEEIQTKLKSKGKKCSYVSLFGKSSLQEINKAALMTVYLANKIESKKTKVRKFLHLADKFTTENKYDKLNLAIQGIDALLSVLNRENLKNTIICFDDLERMDNNIDFKDFLGFVNDLAEHQKCKVILIFNEKELFALNTYNKIIYQTFKEKTIDLEVIYTPTIENNFDIAYKITKSNIEKKYQYAIMHVLEELKEINIRIISKCLYSLNNFIKAYNTICNDYKTYRYFEDIYLFDVVETITLITHCYWKHSSHLWKFLVKNNNETIHTQINKLYPNKNIDRFITYGDFNNIIGKQLLYGYTLPTKNELISFFEEVKEKMIYHLTIKSLITESMNFWDNNLITIDEYKNRVLGTISDKDTAYIFFTYDNNNFLQSFVLDDDILSNDTEFITKYKKILSNSIYKLIDKYYKGNIMLNDTIISNLKFISPDSLKIIQNKSLDYINSLLQNIYQITDEYEINLINNISMDDFKKIYETNYYIFYEAIRLFVNRELYPISNKLTHYLYIIAKNINNAICINYDNKIKYNIICSKLTNNRKYDIEIDTNNYINLYRNNHPKSI